MKERKPKFCSYCGAELIERVINDGYDPFTGEIVVKNVLLCPELGDVHGGTLKGYLGFKTKGVWATVLSVDTARKLEDHHLSLS